MTSEKMSAREVRSDSGLLVVRRRDVDFEMDEAEDPWSKEVETAAMYDGRLVAVVQHRFEVEERGKGSPLHLVGGQVRMFRAYQNVDASDLETRLCHLHTCLGDHAGDSLGDEEQKADSVEALPVEVVLRVGRIGSNQKTS